MLKAFFTVFATVFLAEIGDKTQLATLTLAAGNASRWTVLCASATALVATSIIAVLLGDTVARLVSPHVLRRVAGVVFVVLGVLFFLTKPDA